MANQRSPARDKSRQMWLDADGKRPLIDIAEACGVSAGLVRKWKAIDHWALEDGKKKPAPDVTNGNADGNGNGNGNVKKRKRGGQPGNCNNPKGNPSLPPAPKGNNRNPKGLPLQSNFKTGEYERIVFSSMSEDDKAVAYDSAAMSPAELAIRAIALFSVREKRMLDRISGRMQLSPATINGTPMCVSHAVNTKTECDGDCDGDDTRKTQSIAFENLISFVTELEDSLTSVQAKKMSAVESLHRILRDGQMIELEKQKLKAQEERAANEQKRWEFENGILDENEAPHSIEAWTRATRPNEDDVKALFESEGDSNGTDEA